MAVAMLGCLAAMNACIPGGDPSPKRQVDLVGEWVTDYPEEGTFDEMPYDRVVEHYAFFIDNTGYYELFLLKGEQLVGAEYVRGPEGKFKYQMLVTGDIGVMHSYEDYWPMKLTNGVLLDPEELVYHRATEEMKAQMTTWANCLTPGWLAEKLMGKWMIADIDDKPTPTNRKTVLTFVSATKAFMSRAFDKPDDDKGTPPGPKPDIEPGQGQGPKPAPGPKKPGWEDSEEFDVTIQGNQVALKKVKEGRSQMASVYLILDITNTDFICSFTLPEPPRGPEGDEGGKEAKDERQRFEKIEDDYEQAIVGLWEGRSTGEHSEFDDGENHRWEYFSDGTFHYYEKVNGEWQQSKDEFADYFVDGVLLCTRWKNVGENTVVNREWWEIASINEGVMKWTALRQREDGSTYITTFEMKEIERP